MLYLVKKKNGIERFDAKTATTKQKGNYGEYKADYNLIHNQSLKDAGYDLELIGRPAPTSLDDTIVKGIDGLYENKNEDLPIKFVIDEAKFGRSRLGKTEDGKQMSDDWLLGINTGNDRILAAVMECGDSSDRLPTKDERALARRIRKALENGQVEKVLTKINASGETTTYRLDVDGKIIGTWP